jgi:hypothetical protein
MGAERFWGSVLAGLMRLSKRQPKLARQLQERLDRFAFRWDAVLDRFPEHWVAEFYMPDIRVLAEADTRHAAAVSERLARLQEENQV